MDTRPSKRLCQLLVLSFAVCLLFPSKLTARPGHPIDSLLIQLETATEDSLKIKCLFEICGAYRSIELRESALSYAKEIIKLSERNGYVNWLAKAYYIASGYAIGIGQNEDALFYASNALGLAEQEKMFLLMPNILNNVGLAHYRKGDWNQAMVYFKRGLELNDEIHGDSTVSGYIANSLGGIYASRGDHTKARSYFQIMLTASQDLNDTVGMSVALTNIGECEFHIEKIDRALGYYNQALSLSEKVGDEQGISYLLSNIGNVHLSKENIPLAEQCFQKSRTIAKKLVDYDGNVRASIGLAKISEFRGLYHLSNRYCQSSLAIAQDIGSKLYMRDIYQQLSINYEALKDFSKAFKYQKLLLTINDSLFNETKNRQVEELSILYETNKREAENQLLIEEKEKDKAIIERRNTIVALVALSLLLVSVFAFHLFSKNKQKKKNNDLLEAKVDERTKELSSTNSKLIKSNKDLEEFAYICSHDLKEPLRNIHGFTALLDRKLKQHEDADAKEYIAVVQSSVNQMNRLIDGVLEYSKVEYDVNLSDDIDLNQLTDRLKILLKGSIEAKNVLVSTKGVHIFKGNSSLVFLLLKSLVENAIKYNQEEQPIVEISSKLINDQHQISVKDNDIGIEEQYFKQIFTIFKRLHTRKVYQGAGIGLSICKKITQNLGGDIWVESKLGEGSRFIFVLPNHPKNEIGVS